MFDIGANTLIKIGGILLVFVLVAGAGFYKGMGYVQGQWDAAVGRQAVEAAENLIKNAENTAKEEQARQAALEKLKKRNLILAREVKAYADGTATKCVESPEFVRTFDTVSGMREPGADSVPAAPSPTGEPVVAPEAPVTDVEVLRVHAATVAELDALWTDYDALRSWVRSSYAIAKEGAGRE